MRPRATWIVSLALLAGCPDSNKGSGDAADVNSGVPTSGKIQKKPKDPAKPAETAPKPADPFPRDVLVELYKAEQLGDKAVLRKHGVVDAKGNEVPAKAEEYNAALKRFAENEPDEWSKLVDSIESAKVTTGDPAGVQKK